MMAQQKHPPYVRAFRIGYANFKGKLNVWFLRRAKWIEMKMYNLNNPDRPVDIAFLSIAKFYIFRQIMYFNSKYHQSRWEVFKYQMKCRETFYQREVDYPYYFRRARITAEGCKRCP